MPRQRFLFPSQSQFYRKNHYTYYSSNKYDHTFQSNNFSNFNNNEKKITDTININSCKTDSFFNINSNEALFNFLGIKIYFDDLLIILLLLFLLEEGIQDEYLYIALILLLFN